MTTTENGFRHPEYLVETDWLEKHLDDPDLRVFDCTVIATMKAEMEVGKDFPFAFESGRARYGEGHVPGAGHLDLLGELSDTSSPLPFMMPSEKQFADVMSKAGVGDGARVVLYGTAEPIWAARVWWMLRSFGFDNVAILNGGWAKWSAEGRPVWKEVPNYPKAKFVARPRPGAFVGKDDVLAAIGDNSVCTINALPTMIYEGTGGPVFGRKGRIVGSRNVPFGALHDPDFGTYLPAAQLRAKFDAVHADKADKIIAYCGSGIAAANDAFALALLGYDNVAVYDASLSEWGFDETLPIEAD
jgi:thiosulfate/3-mercaptopyruvate sulfurtransferase